MCSLERRGNVFVLTLKGDGEHKFNPTTIDAITDALNTVAASPDSVALLTTNDGRFFSNGLDLEWITENVEENGALIGPKFNNLLASLMRLGIPTIAAIRGHACAGGFLFALAHDYRFMLKSKSVLYMSELDLGFGMPRSLMTLAKSKLSSTALREAVMKARKLKADDAFDLGVIDALAEEPEEVVAEAVKEAEKLAGRRWNRNVYAQMRLGIFPGVVEELDANRDSFIQSSSENH